MQLQMDSASFVTTHLITTLHAARFSFADAFSPNHESTIMRVIIAGSRDTIVRPAEIAEAVKHSGFEVTELVSGCATGIDQSAEEWAKLMGVPVQPFPYIKRLGRAGGPARNSQMANYADALIAFPGGKGTEDMVRRAKKRGLPVYEVWP